MIIILADIISLRPKNHHTFFEIITGCESVDFRFFTCTMSPKNVLFYSNNDGIINKFVGLKFSLSLKPIAATFPMLSI